jgi:ADP-ribosyl-[dinitrogen reductase] hydrolase
MTPTQDTFRSVLLGGALGDALGWPIEFEKAKTIVKTFGLTAPAKLVEPDFTDDTQMTLFTAEGLIRGRQQELAGGYVNYPSAIRNAYIRWYATQRNDMPFHLAGDGWLVAERALHRQMAPGFTCLGGIADSIEQQRLFTPEAPGNDSEGCGAVMRVAPIGLFFDDRQTVWDQAKASAAVTHGHMNTILAAAYFASLIFDLSRGNTLAMALFSADHMLSQEKDGKALTRVLDRAKFLAGSVDGVTPENVAAVGAGWHGDEALGIALYVLLAAQNESIPQQLWRSVVHDGDSDSTGSILGNLLGAMYPMGEFPNMWKGTEAWAAELTHRDIVEKMAVDLHQSASRLALPEERYPRG